MTIQDLHKCRQLKGILNQHSIDAVITEFGVLAIVEYFKTPNFTTPKYELEFVRSASAAYRLAGY